MLLSLVDFREQWVQPSLGSNEGSRMNLLAQHACSFLETVYDPHAALFPYTTRVVHGRYVSSFDHPSAIRYSINCLLALRTAENREPGAHKFAARADELVADFLDRNEASVVNDGDKGLLLALLAGRNGAEGNAADRAFARVGELDARDRQQALVLQEVCWLLWGTLARERAGDASAAPVARRMFRTLVYRFLNQDSFFPRHSLARHRRGTVSFGGLVYFLQTLHEYALLTGDEHAEWLFREGVSRVVAAQGTGGEWPWFFDVRTGAPIDLYPVYSVHQDSMAMLFLLPALDRGLPRMHEAIERSYAWVLGRNQLGQSMIALDPFLRYRSLERRGPLQRARRYGRSFLAGHDRRLARRSERVQINRECRSYEMGWIIYAWAGRRELLSVTPEERSITFPAPPDELDGAT